MVLRTRADALGGLRCGVVTQEITRTSQLVSRMTGYPVQPNKAIVGRNAFAHEAGIHQHGVLSQPADLRDHGLRERGPGRERDRAGQALRPPRAAQRASRSWASSSTATSSTGRSRASRSWPTARGASTTTDLEALVGDEMRVERRGAATALRGAPRRGRTSSCPRRRVRSRSTGGRAARGRGVGNGPLDAAIKATDAAAGPAGRRCSRCTRAAVTSGKDALARGARARASIDGRRVRAARPRSTDSIEASAQGLPVARSTRAGTPSTASAAEGV